jgi:flagellar basal-body rod protein FlgG
MTATLAIAASGMIAQQTNSELIADNFANISTVAHKRKRSVFQNEVHQQTTRPGAPSSDAGQLTPAGIQRGGGVRIASTYRVNEQGLPDNTGNPYDVMVKGDGYLHVSLPDGTSAYTRAGNFNQAPDGTLVTLEGYNVMPGIKIPAGTQMNINANGTVSVHIDGQTSEQILGVLELVRFTNEGGLMEIGQNLLKETDSSGAPQIGIPGNKGYGTILQGFLEASNVNPIQEVVTLIKTQRGFEFNSKVVEAEEKMEETTVRMVQL